jgi:phosphoglycolate phosphatase
VAAGLAALHGAGWRIACVTNKPGEFADALLKATGLRDPFALVLGGDALPLRKPHPAPLLEACRRLGVGPAEAVMIGDSSNDAQAARAAGCRSVLVRGGYNHGQPLETAGADALAATFSEAVSLLGIAA